MLVRIGPYDYNPDAGTFTWAVRTSNRVTIGARAGFAHGNGYIAIYWNLRKVFAHQLAWLAMTGVFPEKGQQVDHIDMDRANTRWANLRLATNSLNGRNRGAQANNRLGLKNVCTDRTGRFRAVVQHKGRQHVVGIFDDKHEAHRAAATFNAQHFGEFARCAS